MAPLTLRVLACALFAAAATSALCQPPPPQPLGPPPVPAQNPLSPAKVNLGKVLFWDEQLSSTNTVACGTCHFATSGGSDPRSQIGSARATHPGPNGVAGDADDIVASPGVIYNDVDGEYEWQSIFGYREQVTRRKARSFVDAAYAPDLFWDGRATSQFRDPVTNEVLIPVGGALESQAAGPPTDSGEMGYHGRDWPAAAAKIAASTPLALSPQVPTDLANYIGGRSYPELFQEVFGSSAVTPARIIFAIAAYERVTNSTQTPFDAFLGGNNMALTPAEMRGLGVFNQNCGVCHAGALTSNNLYHYIGVRPVNDDLGRFEVTGNNADRGAFRTPGLRNVELRAPYFHNGRFPTLESVIDFYNRGGDFTAPNKDPRIVPLGLTAGQRADLAAFLRRPLTDPRVAAGTAPFDRPLLFTESDSVPEFSGAGVPGTAARVPRAIAIEPPIVGNPSFTVAVTDGLPGARAVLVIDDVDPGTGRAIPVSGSFAFEEITLADSGSGIGYGSVSLAIPFDGALVGDNFTGRWYVEDPAATDGVAVSRAFSFTIFGSAPVAPAMTGNVFIVF